LRRLMSAEQLLITCPVWPHSHPERQLRNAINRVSFNGRQIDSLASKLPRGLPYTRMTDLLKVAIRFRFG